MGRKFNFLRFVENLLLLLQIASPRLKKQRGQAMVEYAAILIIALVSASIVYELTSQTEGTLVNATEVLENDTGDLPHFQIENHNCHTNDDCVRLSPPVAKYIAPEINHKGREIKFVDDSYDTDEHAGGYVEHWYWVINGEKEYRSREQMMKDGAFIKTFRKSGTYEVTLYVFDNDGLVSQPYTTVIKIENRPPVLSVEVSGPDNIRKREVTIGKNCTATFYTAYDDEDLPYDSLRVNATFTDHTGQTQNYATAPNNFKRDFINVGRNSYRVTVTDEDGASVTQTVYVNVTENGACPTQTLPPPKYKIDLSRNKSNPELDLLQGNTPQGIPVHYFEVGETAIAAPVVDWRGNTPHGISPYYWEDNFTQDAGKWYSESQKIRNHPYPSFKFQKEHVGKEYLITGQARTGNAVDDRKDCTNRQDSGKSNCDSVIIKVIDLNPTYSPIAAISLDIDASTPIQKKTGYYQFPFKGTDISKNRLIVPDKTRMKVQSLMSFVQDGAGDKATTQFLKENPEHRIVGVLWDNHGERDALNFKIAPNGSNAAGLSTIDVKGVGKVYSSLINTPDTTRAFKTFVGDKDKNGAPIPREYRYTLTVATEGGKTNQASAVYIVGETPKKPIAVCTPEEIKTYVNVNAQMNASKSSDPNKTRIKASWSTRKDFTGADTIKNIDINDGPHKYFKTTRATPNDLNVFLKVTNEAGVESDIVTCVVKVERAVAGDAFFHPEIWGIEDRILLASRFPSYLHNQTNLTGARILAPKTIGGKSKKFRLDQFRTTGIRVGQFINASSTGPFTYYENNNSSANETTPHLSNHVGFKNGHHIQELKDKPGAFRVQFYANAGRAPKPGECISGNSVYDAGIKEATSTGAVACRKDTMYFRFGNMASNGKISVPATPTERTRLTEALTPSVFKDNGQRHRYMDAIRPDYSHLRANRNVCYSFHRDLKTFEDFRKVVNQSIVDVSGGHDLAKIAKGAVRGCR